MGSDARVAEAWKQLASAVLFRCRQHSLTGSIPGTRDCIVSIRECMKSFTRRSHLLKLLTVLAPCFLTVFLTLGASTDAFAISNGNAYSTTYGFDSCQFPTTSDMSTWITYSPYRWHSIYIGGESAGCPAGGISSWLNTVEGQGWNFEYTWVGLQPPCSNYANTFSSNTTTAETEGENDAYYALQQLSADGVANNAVGTPIIFDLETAGNGTCQAAVNAFIQGWVNYLNEYPAEIPGVYGSVCGSNLAALATLSPAPSFIWGSDPDNNPNTAVLDDGPNGCGGVPNGDWTNQQRLKQYVVQVQSPSYGGVSLPIDEDCANSWTTPSGLEASNCN